MAIMASVSDGSGHTNMRGVQVFCQQLDPISAHRNPHWTSLSVAWMGRLLPNSGGETAPHLERGGIWHVTKCQAQAPSVEPRYGRSAAGTLAC